MKSMPHSTATFEGGRTEHTGVQKFTGSLLSNQKGLIDPT